MIETLRPGAHALNARVALFDFDGTLSLIRSGWVEEMVPMMVEILADLKSGETDEQLHAIVMEYVSRLTGRQTIYQMIEFAEQIAKRWEISREDMEHFALASHQRAIAAMDAGYFKREIAPIAGVENDEGARRDSSLEKMASLKTLMPEGRLTAAMASQISDGAAALLIASEKAVKEHNLKPRARIHHMSVRGDDPILMLTAPIRATRYALAKAGMTMNDIDLVEINEAFAPVVLAWLKDIGYDHAKTNVNDGAISLGHPLGATGARLMTTMLPELERTGKRYGLQTMCEGGGQANVTIIERL